MEVKNLIWEAEYNPRKQQYRLRKEIFLKMYKEMTEETEAFILWVEE